MASLTIHGSCLGIDFVYSPPFILFYFDKLFYLDKKDFAYRALFWFGTCFDSVDNLRIGHVNIFF
jgi:hypothetical protein